MHKNTILSTAVVLSVCMAIFTPLTAQDEERGEVKEGKTYPVNLSLYYPVSINQSKHDRVNLNLGLLYTQVGYVEGIDLTLLASAINHELKGFQLCGLIAVVGDSGQGGQISGLISVSGDSFTGLQVGGLMNVVGERGSVAQVSGLFNVVGDRGSVGQVSGLFNVVGEEFEGFQICGGFNVAGASGKGLQAVGLFNVVGEEFLGLQAAGLFNVAGERFEGVQVSGMLNVTGEDMLGLQIGTFNVAPHQRGAQIGVANVAEENRGVQIGLVNYCKEDNLGVPIGAVNIARNGRIKGIAWGGNGVALSGGVKFEIGRYYSIVSLGALNVEDNIGESLAYGLHYGLRFPLRRFSLNTDLGYRYRDNTPFFRNPEDELDQHIWEGRLWLGIPISGHLNLVVGSGLGHSFSRGSGFGSGNTYPLLLAGLEWGQTPIN